MIVCPVCQKPTLAIVERRDKPTDLVPMATIACCAPKTCRFWLGVWKPVAEIEAIATSMREGTAA
jgi:hypothetical protein